MGAKPVAVVTGGNRGIGFEICRQLAERKFLVVLAARDELKGEDAAESLRSEELDVVFMPLDVTSDESVRAFAEKLEARHGRLDVLVNNAGVFLDKDKSPLAIGMDAVHGTFEVNTFGPLRMVQALAPLMKKSGQARVVNVSSEMGSLAKMGPGYLAYRASKTALNAVTRILAEELKGTGVLVNAMCPGWVKTDMGGPNAPRTVAQGADTALWLATLPNEGPTGGFFQSRQPLAW